MKRGVLIGLLGGMVTTAFAQQMSDPMRPPAGMHASPARAITSPSRTVLNPLEVRTIIIGPDRRYAVIDGRTIAEGDQVRGMHVLKIAEVGVTLRDRNGKDLTLPLLPAMGAGAGHQLAESTRTDMSARATK